MGVEDAARHHQDRRVDQKREHQRHRAVDQRDVDGAPPGRLRAAILPGLHQRGMQVEVMRHHGGADDADADIEHAGIGQQRPVRRQPG